MTGAYVRVVSCKYLLNKQTLIRQVLIRRSDRMYWCMGFLSRDNAPHYMLPIPDLLLTRKQPQGYALKIKIKC